MPQDALATLTTVHDACLVAWDTAFHTGDAGPLATFLAPAYQGFFGYAGTAAVQPVDRAEATTGARRFIAHLRGAVHQGHSRTIRMRSATEAVVSYERTIEHNGQPWGSFLVLQVWHQSKNGGWHVVREIAENIAAK